MANCVERSKRKAKKNHSNLAPKKERLVPQKDVDDDGSDIDCSKELYPLSHYIGNREEMLNQAFAAVGKKDLKALLFPAIEHLSLDELKTLCLGQLQEMSDKEVAVILDGKKLNSSPGSIISSESDDDTQKLCFQEKRENLNKKEEKDYVNPNTVPAENLKVVTEELMQCLNCELKLPSTNVNSQQNVNESEGHVEESEETRENKEKLMLEVMELELRARAIRALLEYHKEDPSTANDFEKNITP